MKKLSLSLALLCSYTAGMYADAAVAAALMSSMPKRQKTDFGKIEFIKKSDGTFFNATTIHESLNALSKVTGIQYGEKDKTTGKRAGFYAYDGKQVTLQDLVIEEHRLTKEGVSKEDARWKTFSAALTTAKDDFLGKMKSVRGIQDDNDLAKKMKANLISHFIQDQKLTNSLLANAGLPDEQTRLYAASATEFFSFLNDLKHFIEDLVESCPKAHKQYKELTQRSK